MIFAENVLLLLRGCFRGVLRAFDSAGDLEIKIGELFVAFRGLHSPHHALADRPGPKHPGVPERRSVVHRFPVERV